MTWRSKIMRFSRDLLVHILTLFLGVCSAAEIDRLGIRVILGASEAQFIVLINPNSCPAAVCPGSPNHAERLQEGSKGL